MMHGQKNIKLINWVYIWTSDNSPNTCIFTVAVSVTQRVARFISPDPVRASVPNHAIHFIRYTCLHLAARSWAASTPRSLLPPSFLPIYFVLHSDAAVRVTSAAPTGHWRRFCGIPEHLTELTTRKFVLDVSNCSAKKPPCGLL